MPMTGDWRDPAPEPGAAVQLRLLPRRRVLVGLVGLAGTPAVLALAACTHGAPEPEPSGSSSSSAGGSTTANTAPTDPPPVDASALEGAAAEAIALLAAYEATVAAHAELGPVLAPYEIDHETHLDALAEHIAMPTVSPPASIGATTAGPASSGPPVPADAAAARAAVAQAEKLTGEAARDAARLAQDGEAARLLASIGASRGVHALLLGAAAE